MDYEPKSFELAGHTITVEYCGKCFDGEDNLGTWFGNTNVIKIRTHETDGTPFPPEKVEEIFWHEVEHAGQTIFGVNVSESHSHAGSETIVQLLKQFGKMVTSITE